MIGEFVGVRSHNLHFQIKVIVGTYIQWCDYLNIPMYVSRGSSFPTRSSFVLKVSTQWRICDLVKGEAKGEAKEGKA